MINAPVFKISSLRTVSDKSSNKIWRKALYRQGQKPINKIKKKKGRFWSMTQNSRRVASCQGEKNLIQKEACGWGCDTVNWWCSAQCTQYKQGEEEEGDVQHPKHKLGHNDASCFVPSLGKSQPKFQSFCTPQGEKNYGSQNPERKVDKIYQNLQKLL